MAAAIAAVITAVMAIALVVANVATEATTSLCITLKGLSHELDLSTNYVCNDCRYDYLRPQGLLYVITVEYKRMCQNVRICVVFVNKQYSSQRKYIRNLRKVSMNDELIKRLFL
jgi:hypothetical protein